MSLVKLLKYVSAGAMLTVPYSCGVAESPGCSTDHDCKGERVCVQGECVGGTGNSNGGSGGGIPIENPAGNGDNPVITEPSCDEFDPCDGIDNNCNGIVDELGCGRIYLVDQDDLALKVFDLSILEITQTIPISNMVSILPKLSPDASRLALLQPRVGREPGDGTTDIYIHNLTNQQTEIIPNADPTGWGYFNSLDWYSANEIIYSARVGVGDNFAWDGFFVINTDGRNRKKLLEEESLGSIPRIAMSPNKRKVAFASYLYSGPERLFVANSSLTDISQLTTGVEGNHIYTWKGNEEIFFTCKEKKGICSGSSVNLKVEHYGRIVFNPAGDKAYVSGIAAPGTVRGKKDAIWGLETNKLYTLGQNLGAYSIDWRE